MSYEITNQVQIRRLFWGEHPDLPRRRIKNYAGTGLMYPTDTRVAFTDFVDALCRSGQISDDLAQRATLETSSGTKRMPNEEQLKALNAYKAKHGRYWKRDLMNAWMNGSDANEPDGHLLRQIRNQFGPAWLTRF